MPSLEAHVTPIIPYLGQLSELPGLSRSVSQAICMSCQGPTVMPAAHVHNVLLTTEFAP